MSVRKSESFTFRCDACGEQVGASFTSLPLLLIAQASFHTHVSDEDNSGFCARCMKIYRSVALSLIPEAFATEEAKPCE